MRLLDRESISIVWFRPTRPLQAGGTVVDPGPSSISKTITVPSGGTAIAIYSNRAPSTVTTPTTWTNATLDNDALNVGGVGTVVSSAHTTSTGSVAITANTVGNTNNSPMVLTTAAWGP
jgi:hypothetical protein